MNPETLYFVAVGLCGIGLLCVGGAVISLARKVRRLEAKLQDIPRRYIGGMRPHGFILDEPNFYGKETGTGADLADEIKAINRRLPRGRGLT